MYKHVVNKPAINSICTETWVNGWLDGVELRYIDPDDVFGLASMAAWMRSILHPGALLTQGKTLRLQVVSCLAEENALTYDIFEGPESFCLLSAIDVRGTARKHRSIPPSIRIPRGERAAPPGGREGGKKTSEACNYVRVGIHKKVTGR